mmetsp:Transcript_20848/g.47317  ORF Transcript_20848/g.47317 Transcript_20848/m.47317 type:complete len:150 (+) Transcript_20848:152-601(+)
MCVEYLDISHENLQPSAMQTRRRNCTSQSICQTRRRIQIMLVGTYTALLTLTQPRDIYGFTGDVRVKIVRRPLHVSGLRSLRSTEEDLVENEPAAGQVLTGDHIDGDDNLVRRRLRNVASSVSSAIGKVDEKRVVFSELQNRDVDRMFR